MNPHRLFGMAVMNVALAAVCSGVNAEGIDIDFNAAIDRAVAMFPMLAGQTYLTVDANRNKVNWMPDAAELYLVHEILAHPELPHHQDVLAAWQANRMQMARDLGGAGTKQDQALGDFLAGLITSNSKNISSISMIFSFVASLGDSQDLSFTSDKYVSLDALLAFNADVREPGDYDGDGVSNNAEFNFALSYGKARYGTFSDGRVKSAFWADDIDGDGLSIYADSDSDGDGLSDGYESNVDQDQFLDYLSMPKDKWMTPNPPTADDIFVNPDADELENFLDTDSDNDGKSDRDEGIADSDGDYIPEFLDGVAGTNPPKPQVPVEPDDVVIQKDIVYGTVDGIDLKLDLARPAKGQGPFPLIVCIHGGGWQLGDKGGYINAIRAFAKRDYVAVSVNYRLAPKHKFPAQIEDVKCAVRYLRSRAEELNINAAMVGATGDSAGGYLSLMLGLLDPKDNLEGAC